MTEAPALTVLALLLCAAPAVAAEPRSAIPWLSESVRNPVILEPVKGTSPADAIIAITATPLTDIDRDGIGLIPSHISGLPEDLWGNSPRDRIAELILAHPQGGVPATRALFRQILLASTKSPGAASGSKNLLLTRVDRLLDIGALDDAEALLNLAGVTDQQSYRRMVDIGLLTGRADPVCAKFAETPNLAPTLPIRVFCLARASDWNAAALTLSLGIEIGAIPENQGELLTMFLDPHLFEETHEPALPETLSAFDFVIRESLALPRPAENLPLAFLQVDLVRDTPMRSRIEAAEKLVRTGAITHTQLFAAYRAGKPAASGGVWDRAAAVQALDAAIALGDSAQVVAALEALAGQTRGLGLSVAIAREYSGALLRLPGHDNLGMARTLLLAGDAGANAWLPNLASPDYQLAAKLLTGASVAQFTDPPNPARQAIIAAFNGETSGSGESLALKELLAEGRKGEAILAALAILARESQGPDNLQTALAILTEAGLERFARTIAVETLLLAGDGL